MYLSELDIDGGQTGEPWENPPVLVGDHNPSHILPRSWIKPMLHWCKLSGLTTALIEVLCTIAINFVIRMS